MRAARTFVLSFLVVFVVATLVRHGIRALRPARPADMPERSIFVQSGFDVSRNVPRGEWVACAPDVANDVILCRISNEQGIVEFDGAFLPLRSATTPPGNALQLAEIEEANLWVQGPAEGGALVPVLPLASGDVLVPAADREALRSRWATNPDELARVLTPSR